MGINRLMEKFNQEFNFHHIGYACRNVEEYKKSFLPLAKNNNFLIYDDVNQNVKVLFIEMIGDYKIELIQILDNTLYCPIKKYIDKNVSGYHHVCYEVQNIEDAIYQLKQNGYRLISKTINGFENRTITFFISKSKPDGPLIEIVSKMGE
jgi:methylmalonyl-CoA/ethylmalonyl-CoA epimerase